MYIAMDLTYQVTYDLRCKVALLEREAYTLDDVHDYMGQSIEIEDFDSFRYLCEHTMELRARQGLPSMETPSADMPEGDMWFDPYCVLLDASYAPYIQQAANGMNMREAQLLGLMMGSTDPYNPTSIALIAEWRDTEVEPYLKGVKRTR